MRAVMGGACLLLHAHPARRQHALHSALERSAAECLTQGPSLAACLHGTYHMTRAILRGSAQAAIAVDWQEPPMIRTTFHRLDDEPSFRLCAQMLHHTIQPIAHNPVQTPLRAPAILKSNTSRVDRASAARAPCEQVLPSPRHKRSAVPPRDDGARSWEDLAHPAK
jgi:hypothetical protein